MYPYGVPLSPAAARVAGWAFLFPDGVRLRLLLMRLTAPWRRVGAVILGRMPHPAARGLLPVTGTPNRRVARFLRLRGGVGAVQVGTGCDLARDWTARGCECGGCSARGAGAVRG